MYSVGDQAVPPLSCEFNASDKPDTINFIITNNDANLWSFLSWHTPFDAWFSEFMTITTVDGSALLYQGALAKRGAPRAADMMRIIPGKPLSVQLNLSQAYQIPPATYLIKIKPFSLKTLMDPKETFILHCPPFTLRIPEDVR